MVSDYAAGRDGTRLGRVKPWAGKIGMLMLSASFFIWAVLLSTGGRSNFSYSFVYSPFMQILGTGTIFLTAGGLFMANIGLGSMARKWKYLSRYSTFFFVWMNVTGFYLAYNSLWGGPYFLPSQTEMFIVSSSAVFAFYIAIFSLFIVPLLKKAGFLLLMLSAVLNELFVTIIQLYSYASYTASMPLNVGSGANFPYVLNLMEPIFGFLWFQLNFGALQGAPYWIYILPAVSNFILAALYISPLLPAVRTKAIRVIFAVRNA